MNSSSHPHDPFASEPGTAPDVPQVPQDAPAYGSAQPTAADAGPQQPSAVPPQHSPYGAPQSHGQSHGQAPYGAHPTGEDVPPAGTAGVYEGPLSGQPVSRSDAKLWATFAQGSVALGHVISMGFLGWVGPLIIFLMYKDRDRFVRFHATEALNGAIAVFIAQLVLGIAVTILTIFTLGFASILFPLVGVPALIQLIFSIIGAVKANQGEYWAYPFNLRLVK